MSQSPPPSGERDREAVEGAARAGYEVGRMGQLTDLPTKAERH